MCMSEQWEGVWRGSYYYDAPEQPETPPAPFDLRIEEVMPDGSIRGEIVDMPDDTPPGPRASLVGRIDGDQVRFTKDYGQGQVADENGRLVGLRDLYRRHGIRMLDRRGGVIEYQGQLFEGRMEGSWEIAAGKAWLLRLFPPFVTRIGFERSTGSFEASRRG